MNLYAAIEALRAEIVETHDHGQAVAAALAGLRVLSALLAHTQHPAAPTHHAISTTTPPPLDVRKIRADVVAALAAEDAAAQTPEPPAARPLPVADPPADDAPQSTSSAQAPEPAAAPRKPGRPPLASWTAARRALLPRYKTDDLTALLADINALPGAAITMKALINKASADGIIRDPEAKRAAIRAAMRKRMEDDDARARQAVGARATLAKAREAKASRPPPSGTIDTETPIVVPSGPPSPLKERVREAMTKGVDRWDIWAGQHKAPLREVYRLKGEIERERKDAA